MTFSMLDMGSDIIMFHLHYDTHRDEIDFPIVYFLMLCVT